MAAILTDTSSIKAILSILASLLLIFGAFAPYLRDIFQKKTKPHIYTWFIWSITQGVAVAGLWYGNGGWGTISLAIGTAFVFFISLLSFKYGTKNITISDTILLIAALFAIVIWRQLHNPILAVVLVTIIDVLGYVPSYRKSFLEPWSETVATWVIFCVANILTILAFREYNMLTLVYPLGILTANLLFVIICLTRR